MIEDKIREVMRMVDSYAKACAEYDAHLDDVPLYDESMDLAREQLDKKHRAIESKLRALLEEKQEPQWQSIDSAPKEDLILAFERRWCFAEWSVIHGGWFEEDAPVGGRLNPSHWMPIPPDPCN